MEQIEIDLDDANKTIQGFQNKIKALDGEKHEILNKFETTKREMENITSERDQYRKESKKAKESMDEIRQMLADTREKARKHYYKEKAKK